MTHMIGRPPPPQHRYRFEREGLYWVVRAGTGTRVLFKCWRQDTAIRVTTELLTAYLDGEFVGSRQERVRAERFANDASEKPA